MVAEFRFLTDCKPLELIRVKLNNESAFALAGGMEPNSRRGFIILSGVKPPHYIHFMHQGSIDGDFENYKMLSYGKDNYEIRPDHSEECVIAVGPLFRKIGAFVLTDKDRFLVVRDHPQQERYFSLQIGLMQGEPGSVRLLQNGKSSLRELYSQ